MGRSSHGHYFSDIGSTRLAKPRFPPLRRRLFRRGAVDGLGQLVAAFAAIGVHLGAPLRRPVGRGLDELHHRAAARTDHAWFTGRFAVWHSLRPPFGPKPGRAVLRSEGTRKPSDGLLDRHGVAVAAITFEIVQPGAAAGIRVMIDAVEPHVASTCRTDRGLDRLISHLAHGFLAEQAQSLMSPSWRPITPAVPFRSK